MIRKRKTFIIFLLFSWIINSLILITQPVFADRLESESYVVTFGNFNVTSGEKNSANYNITDTVGQIGAGPYGSYGGSNYFIGSGFQYIYQINTFSFTISDISIALGELSMGTHNTDTNNLTITTKGAGGYSIYAYETHPLRHSNGSDTIADTSCNAGDCTISNATIWNNQNIAGFGYNINGHDTPSDFVDSTYFRPFADDNSGDTMQTVMSSSNIANARTATVTYKAGISATQAAGNYETSIVYIAIPGY